jgi:hypothetical protein
MFTPTHALTRLAAAAIAVYRYPSQSFDASLETGDPIRLKSLLANDQLLARLEHENAHLSLSFRL